MDGDSSGRSSAVANLAARWRAKRAQISSRLGVDLAPSSPPPHRVAVEVALFGDRVGQQRWSHDARVAAAIRDPGQSGRVLRSNQQPALAQTLYVPRATAVAHATDIYFRFAQPLNIAVELHGRPPLSLHGPSGTSLVALCNLPCAAVAAVARLQTGDLALQRFPWRPRSGLRLHSDAPGASGTGVAGDDFEFSDADDSSSESSGSELDEADDGETVQGCSSATDSDDRSLEAPASDDGNTVQNCASDTDSEPGFSVTACDDARQTAPDDSREPRVASAGAARARFMSTERQCRLCNLGHEHPYHFFFECTAGRFVSLRDAMHLDAPLQYWRILAAIRDAVLSEDRLEVYDLGDTGDAVKAAFADANRAQAHWLTHRLLWAMPWSARNVPPTASAAFALGELFDDTVLSRHALRPMVDSWVGWSAKWTRRFGDEWASHRQVLNAASASGQ
jgi:hypothetical protein